MATDSRGHRARDDTPADMPSQCVIGTDDDDPLEYRGATPEISVDRGFKSLQPHPVLIFRILKVNAEGRP